MPLFHIKMGRMGDAPDVDNFPNTPKTKDRCVNSLPAIPVVMFFNSNQGMELVKSWPCIPG